MGKIKLTLDPENTGRKYIIYQVDGVRGTLKELSDYFNVDPVSVSDLLLDGYSIQDALCMAKPGFKPKEKIEAEQVKKEKEEQKKQEKIRKQQEKEKREQERKLEKERLDKAKQIEKEKKAVEKEQNLISKFDFDSAISEDLLTTKSVSDVQDLGDVIIITTTTTCVYRKRG